MPTIPPYYLTSRYLQIYLTVLKCNIVYVATAMMRRGSMAVPGGGEPLIVVEESGVEDSEASYRAPAPIRGFSEDQESPPDPYHLSPWRETRKHSLPTPSCTSGPTASQVTRKTLSSIPTIVFRVP